MKLSVNIHVHSTWLCFSPPQGGCGLLESNNLGDRLNRGHIGPPKEISLFTGSLGKPANPIAHFDSQIFNGVRASEIPGLPAEPMDSDHVQSTWVSNAN